LFTSLESTLLISLATLQPPDQIVKDIDKNKDDLVSRDELETALQVDVDLMTSNDRF
jgi:hypothetical protein